MNREVLKCAASGLLCGLLLLALNNYKMPPDTIGKTCTVFGIACIIIGAILLIVNAIYVAHAKHCYLLSRISLLIVIGIICIYCIPIYDPPRVAIITRKSLVYIVLIFAGATLILFLVGHFKINKSKQKSC